MFGSTTNLVKHFFLPPLIFIFYVSAVTTTAVIAENAERNGAFICDLSQIL